MGIFKMGIFKNLRSDSAQKSEAAPSQKTTASFDDEPVEDPEFEDDDELDDDEPDEYEVGDDDKRVAAILGKPGISKYSDIPDVDEETLLTYREYLRKHLQLPCQLTGIEGFSWEERFVFGYGSQAEYEQLKKKNASYTDTFDLLTIHWKPDSFYGLMVEVKRVSDKKKFLLPLADLNAVDEASPNYQLLDDYSGWFVNHR